MTAKMTGPAAELTAATAHLRVYEPLDAFEDWAQSIILRTPRRTGEQWDAFENERHDQFISRRSYRATGALRLARRPILILRLTRHV